MAASGSEFVAEGTTLVWAMAHHLEQARDAHDALVHLLQQFPAPDPHDVAVRLNITLGHAELLIDGASFEEVLELSRAPEPGASG